MQRDQVVLHRIQEMAKRLPKALTCSKSMLCIVDRLVKMYDVSLLVTKCAFPIYEHGPNFQNKSRRHSAKYWKPSIQA